MLTRFTSSLRECGVCYEKAIVEGKINSCKHVFCYECIRQWSERENTCPLCKVRFTQMYQITRSTRYPLRDEGASHQPINVTERNQEHNPSLLNSSNDLDNVIRQFRDFEEFLHFMEEQLVRLERLRREILEQTIQTIINPVRRFRRYRRIRRTVRVRRTIRESSDQSSGQSE